MEKTQTESDTYKQVGIEEYRPVQSSELPINIKLRLEFWRVIECTLFRFSPRRCIGFRRLLLVAFGAKLHRTVSVSNTARIFAPWNLTMGEYSSICEYSWIYSLDKVIVGRKSCIGQYVKIITPAHNINSTEFSLIHKPVVIGDGVWLALCSIILSGVTVSDFAVVAAGSVVTKDVSAFTVVGGNPAEVIKKREFS